jgi:hypothetical protein
MRASRPIIYYEVITMAEKHSSWDGTWIGNWAGGNGTQIVFAGDEMIALLWNGDYLSEVCSSVSEDGAVVAITWPSAQAFLTRGGETVGHMVIGEKGQPDRSFDVQRENG